MTHPHATPSRRALLGGGLAFTGLGVAGLAGCTTSSTMDGDGGSLKGLVGPNDAVVAQVEAAGGTPEATRTFALTARRTEIDLAGQRAATWAYGDTVPGPLLRATAGDRITVAVRNDLPQVTSVHWHGIRLRNDMDGVPGHTQEAIAADGGTFTYDFITPDPGTYFFHPHVGVQLDRGLYAPLIIDDPAESGDFDKEWVVVLDDWLDGIMGDPDTELETLRRNGSGMMGQGSEIAYPFYLVNGRPPADPETFQAAPGERVRLRIINASSDTVYRVALGGHRLKVTHKDGIPTLPKETDAIIIGMGERYDFSTTVGDGAFPLVAMAEGKSGQAYAVLRTSASAAAPPPDVQPDELARGILWAPLLSGDDHVPRGQERAGDKADRTITIQLGVRGGRYVWTMNGKTFEEADPFVVSRDEVVRIIWQNMSHMPHPMHLHGHSFRLTDGGSWHDTVLVGPMGAVAAQFVADNPGAWMMHCHNIFHAEAGMMATLGYRA